MGLAQLREAKRKDFVRVEYIENTSSAYINTGVNVLNSKYFDIDISFSVLNRNNYIIGQRKKDNTITGSANTMDGILVNTSNNFETGVAMTDAINTDYIVEVDKRYRISGDYKNVTVTYTEVDEETSEDTQQSFTITNGGVYTNNHNQILYLFNINQPTFNTANAMCGKMYGCKLYNGTVLLRDFIPMYQISTDTYGLWDRVEKKFYTSPNGVKFTGGARVVEDANGKLYYIKNYISFAGSGKNLVSIGIKPNETDYYETKWYFAGSGRSNFMGARTKSNNNDYQCYGYSKALHITYDTGNIVNYSVTYTNKAYIFKTYFNKKTNQMYGAIYDANKKLLAQNKVAKRSGAASVVFFIGKQNGLNNYYPPVNSRMYYFKYWRNHNLVRDMIPVQSVETGEYGFFDKVNLKIYYSSGSVDFTGA